MRRAFFMIQQLKSGIEIASVKLRPELIERESVRTIENRILPKEDK